MSLAEYKGPPQNHIAVLPYLQRETIKACFIDADGHLWLIVNSGHAFVCAGFDFNAPAFRVVDPVETQAAMDKRRSEIQPRIQELKNLAPGVDL